MIRDRYEPLPLFDLVPRLQLQFEPELAALDRLLDDDGLFQQVKADFARRSPRGATTGRPTTPVEVVLRMLVVKRLYRWSYAETERFVGDSLVLRQFCRLYLHPAPDDTTLLRWANSIEPQTLERLNDRVVELARSLKVTRGRKLRVDSTVVETNIHHPTDSRLLGDGVRVLSRLLRRSKAVVAEPAALGRDAFRTRTRSVRRLAQQLHRVARRKGEAAAEELKGAYRELIGVARASRGQAERVRAALRAQPTGRARRLAARFDRFLPLVDRAIDQAARRVLCGEAVPAGEKLLSLFEPPTQVIRRHKAGKPVEFGRKLLLDEVDGGIVSRYALAEEPGPDHPHFAASLVGHGERFGRAPDLVAGDRGVSSPANESLARRAGVKRVVLPASGRPSAARRRHERQPWFRRGFRFRAGIEGRISVLKRGYELGRCRDHGAAGMGRWVGWGVVTANLATIARALAARPAAAAARAG